MPRRPSDRGRKDGSTLQTVERALAVLELFRYSDLLGTREIARRLELSPTAVHRIMSTLATRGYVTQEDASRGYRLGPKIRELADSVAINELDIRRLALPHMRQIQDRTGETVVLHTARDGYRIILVEIESPKSLRMVVPVRPYPILFGPATDQIFRAFGDPAMLQTKPEIDDVLPELERQIREGVRDPPDLDEVRERGWAVSYGVRIPGGISIAAPVETPAGLLAVSAFGPADRIRAGGIEKVGEIVADAAKELSATLRIHQSPAVPIAEPIVDLDA